MGLHGLLQDSFTFTLPYLTQSSFLIYARNSAVLINLMIALNNKQTEQTDAHCEDSCS
jgi:hypothetical protein